MALAIALTLSVSPTSVAHGERPSALQPSPGLDPWLAEQQLALAFTTYRANRLLLLGRAAAGGLRVHERLFDRPMGLFAEGDSLWMAGRQQLWRLDNHLADGLLHEGGDRLFVPSNCSITGDVNAHELVVPGAGPWAGRPLFVNTAFSCLAGLERGSSFTPLWQPPFLARLAAEDACHLNGVGLQDGEPVWASACGHQPGPSSWRNDRRTGGVLLHLPSNSVVVTGLSMPHSPRWHQGRLWLLNSGSGELGWIEHDRFQPLCALPGFTRGLAFVGDCAVVGLSKLRSPQFTGLALDDRLAAEGVPGGRCGLRVVDLATGALLHSLDLPEPIDELFDVVALPGVRQPLALGLQDEDIHCLVRLPDPAGQVRVRPLTPSGNPYQGPALAPFGLPAISPVAPGAGQAETGPAVPDPTAVVAPIRYQKVLLLTPANLAPYASLTYPSLAPGSAALGRISGELLGLCALADGAMVALALAERRSEGGAGLISLMVAPSWRRRGIGTGLLHDGGDRLFVPSNCSITGDVKAHELVVPGAGPWAGEPLFINTAFSCLARLRRGFSFEPVWQPPFIARLAAEDACHLNGLALQDGQPVWATACGHRPEAFSWRHQRNDGGVVLHLPSNSVVATGLSMPHSPRWHEGRLWLLNSGRGELGWIEAGRFRSLCTLPGFARGLAFHGGCAVVGLSKLRSPQLSGLALDERLLAEGRPMGCCGLRVIDLASGAVLHGLDLSEPIDELFDVVSLPGVRQPKALGLQGEEIECLVRLPQQAEQLRVRPLAPSGNPYRGPELPGFGLPLANHQGLAPEAASGTTPRARAATPTQPPSAPTALASAESSARSDDVAPTAIRYQRVFHLSPANLAPYAPLTFPALAPGSAALQRIQGELLGLSAMAEGVMVGFAIAERRADGGAQLLSFLVAPPWRRRGIGRGLLGRLMLFLAREGIAPLSVHYQETALSRDAFEPILARLGWSAPQTEFLLLEGRSPQLAAIGWAQRHPLRAPYRMAPWGRLTQEQRQRAAALEVALELRPSDAPPGPDPELSLALLRHDQPVGWLLVQRSGADGLRYSSLYVAPGHRGRGRALALLHEGFQRQHAAGLPIARAAIDPRNQPLQRLLRRHLGTYLHAIGRSRASQTPLRPGLTLPSPEPATARTDPPSTERG